jgi:hypothetical protein
MINTGYQIDYSGWFDEGGYCQVYPIKDKRGWVFKEFRNKKKAQESYNYNQKLAKFDLAPKIYSKVCKLRFAEDGDNHLFDVSDWGYIIECAKTCEANSKISMTDIQDLVEQIQEKTGLKFWDCHWYNVGLVKRNKKNKVVCIDTGKESFDGQANAWGNNSPGPKCDYCEEYQCNCSTYCDSSG